jgi:hypothetical protein
MVQVSGSGVNVASESGQWKGRVKLTEFAKVLRSMRMGGTLLKVGEVLSPEQVAALPRANREALVSNKWLSLHELSAEITR